jgi:hypothetical protein
VPGVQVQGARRLAAGAHQQGDGEAALSTLPPLAADVTDQVTARFCTETGHSCPACPQDARSLHATAHNALGAVEAALAGHGGWDRAYRKMGELKRALETFKGISDGHFAAMEAWRRS